MMNNGNGNGRVLTGQRTNGGMGNPQGLGHPNPGQPNHNGQQQQVNPIAMLMGYANKFANTMNNPVSNMSNMYSYGPSGTNYAALIGMDNQSEVNDEQLKASALAEGGAVGYSIAQMCIRRNTQNVMYQTWRHALDRFKSVHKNGAVEPVMEQFVNNIDSRQDLASWIVCNASVQFSVEVASRLMMGDYSVREMSPLLQELWYKSCIDIVNLQFLDYLGNNPESFYRLSQVAKTELPKREEGIFPPVLNRYVFANQECPYTKGKMAMIAERSSRHNPLLEISQPNDLGIGGSIFDANNGIFGVHGTSQPNDNGMNNWLTQQVARNEEIKRSGGLEYNNVQPRHVSPTYDNFDKPQLKVEDITRENRHQYNLNDYATEVQNGWYILHRYHLDCLRKALVMEDGSTFSMRDTNVLGKLAVYRFDWQQGTFAYRFIDYSVRDVKEMAELLSNPSVLLPYMFDDNGVQKTSFDPKAMETSEFIRDGYVVPMSEVKELDKLPELMISTRPMKANQGNENTVSRIDAFTESHDPKSQLDAFVVPMANQRQWQLDNQTDMDAFYSRFKLMVHGNTEEKIDTVRVLRSLRGQCREYGSEEFTEFLNSYLGTVVNRWLVEVRGYAEETKDNTVPYLRTSDLFTDLEDLVEHMKNNDHPTLRAFMDYGSNEFIRDGIEILMGKEETRKEFEEQFKNEDEETRAVMLTSTKRKIIFKRNSVFINMIKANGPVTTETVYIKESINPELFAIVRKAIEVGSRHFKERPQVLVKFRKDEGNKVWAVTRSGFDPDSVFVLRTVVAYQDYTHPFPLCE